MKKLLALLLVFLMLVTAVVGCSETKKDDSSKPVSSDDVAVDDETDEDNSEEDDYVEEEPEEDDYVEEEPEEDDYVEDDSEEDDYEMPDFGEDDSEEDSNIATAPLTPEEQRLELLLQGEDKELNKDAVYNEGNLARFAKAMKKSKKGETVKLVFFGNATNTALNGIASARVDTPYAYSSIVESWWEENVGPCEIRISGLENMTSPTACLRLDFDVLQYEPDIVFLDFATQDALGNLANSNAIGFDNLVRRLLQHKTAPAVMTLLLTGAEQNSFKMNSLNATMFASASKQHKQVSKYYDIPVIDFEDAVWENFTELVKVTTKKEIPLISWVSIALNNLAMNNSGHKILAGTITSFLENNVLNKLSKISTKDPKYPTEGYFGVDRYMKSTYISVGDIMDDQATKDMGYAFDLDKAGMELYEYDYNSVSSNNNGSMRPNISTLKHFIPEKEEDASREVAPYYLNLTVPEVTNAETYFMIYTPYSVAKKGVPSAVTFGPMSLVCYDKDGNEISTLKPASGTYEETVTTGKTSATKIPVGTTRIEFKLYTAGGAPIYLLGLGEFN